jgi:hypothetical protein
VITLRYLYGEVCCCEHTTPILSHIHSTKTGYWLQVNPVNLVFSFGGGGYAMIM